MTAVLLIVLVTALSAVALLAAGRISSISWPSKIALLFGPSVDAFLILWFLLWLGLSTVNAFMGGLLAGIISLTLLQPLLIPQRLVVWRLAWENIRRRRRQSVLMVAGLVIASSIITSSLVVGDSLDATVGYEVEAAWGETDVLLSGLNPQTGVPVLFDEQTAELAWNSMERDASLSPLLKGRQYGWATSVSLSGSDGVSEPSVSWFARNSSVDALGVWSPLGGDEGFRFSELTAANDGATQPHIAINLAASEELGLDVGDRTDMGWYITDEDQQRVRRVREVVIAAVVANEGQGAMAGSQSPAVFTDLATAQSLAELGSSISRLSIALDDELSDEGVEDVSQQIQDHLDTAFTASDAGLNISLDSGTGAVTISSTSNLGRLNGDDVRGLRENQSTLYPNGVMMEVLQAPLIDAVVAGEPLLTLADSDVTLLKDSNTALWHSSSSGAGFQLHDTNEAWIWQADTGDTLNDIAFTDAGTSASIAHGEGIVLADELELDEPSVASYDTESPVEAVAYGADKWWALEAGGDSLYLHVLSEDYNDSETHPLNITTPSSVLSYDLSVDENVHLRIEGLLSTSYYVSNGLEDLSFVASNASTWADEEPPESIDLHAQCDGVAWVSVEGNGAWCTQEHGLLRWNTTTGGIESVRLPVMSDAPGFGRFPQMFLAFGGENSTLDVPVGHVAVSNRLQGLPLNDTNLTVSVKGVIPYAYGNDTAVFLQNDGVYASLPGFEQLTDLEAVVLGLIHLEDAERLSLADDDERSLLLISGGSFAGNSSATAVENLTFWFDEQSTIDDVYLGVRAVKVDAARQAAESSGLLSAMFLVFGTFTIAAGVLLVLTIIMLLADVRRSELAIARALGLRSSDARAFFVQEGLVLSVVAGGLGSLLGLGLAWVISVGFSSIFASVGAQSFRFDWTLDSFLSGWIWGSLLAIGLLWATAFWNAQLNIVKALRGGRLVLSKGVPWGVYLIQIIGLGGLVMCLGGLFFIGTTSGLSYAAYVLSGVFAMLIFVPLVTWELPVWLSSRPRWSRWSRHGPRNTLGALGSLWLVWTLLLGPIDPIRSSMKADELTFIVLGLLQVFSGVMVLTSIAPLAVKRLTKSRIFTRKFGVVGPVSLAHPLAHPVRTAVVMGMFSITMFSVVVLSGYTAQFDTYSSSFVEDAEGEFELLLTSSRSRPIELDSDPSSWGIDHEAINNIDAVGRIHRAPIHLEDASGERMPYLLRGFDEGFSSHGGLPLYAWDEGLGDTEEEAWESIENFENIVFLDASFGLESTTDGATIVPLQFSIGDSISLIDFSNPKNTRTVMVGGFLQQSSYIFSPGVWMNGEIVDEQFGGEVTRMYVSVSESAQPVNQQESVEEVSAQGKSEQVRRAALELDSVLAQSLAEQSVSVQTVSEEVMVIQSLVLAILSLFQGYLALGLIVGVAGIAVVTVRNVSERRTTIGMLRAIGFRQSHVLAIFIIEVSWVAALGMLNGLLIGYGFHLVLYKAIWEAEGAAFVFPWASTLMLFICGWLIALIATYGPTKRASMIPPSAALRNI
ncbi:FtsX-like permease family protein [Poseidonia sp.]|uniref:ABC transporter permease n=1 Tax=Poseidonia sp. TaxID=2666344 RepID=UPI003F6A015E